MKPHEMTTSEVALGGALLDNETLDFLDGIGFRPESPRQLLIFDTMNKLRYDEKKPVDLVTVSEALKDSGDLAYVGGCSHLAGLLDAVPGSFKRVLEIEARQDWDTGVKASRYNRDPELLRVVQAATALNVPDGAH
jgi:hypothetical protein